MAWLRRRSRARRRQGRVARQYHERLAQKLGITVDQLDDGAEVDARRDDRRGRRGWPADACPGEKLKTAVPGDLRKARGARIRTRSVTSSTPRPSILGLSSDDVQAGLQDGKSLNDLAAEQGVGNLEAQLVAKLTADIQAKLTDGSITQPQADQLEQNLAERVHGIADHKGGAKLDGAGARKGFGGRHGPAQQAPTQTPSQN